MKHGWIYILTNQHHNVVYIGVTSNLPARIMAHRSGEGGTFTRRYKCTKLVHVEEFATIEEAIAREKAVKEWKRAWKDELITVGNPEWLDLFDQING